MTGAMYGAWHGLGSIPERWITPLENAQKIKQLGCDIYRIAVPQG
jgi:ADP-ribosylglycohydrolase